MHPARALTTSLLSCVFVCAAPALASAATLVNINTADLTTLESLPGIGPSKGQAIIDYRTQNGPFAAIADIQNVSGIGPSTLANIEALITVGDAASSVPPTSASPTSSSSGTTSSSKSTPAAVSSSASGLAIGSDRAATLHVPIAFTAAATLGGSEDTRATVSWSFGDGSVAEGAAASKTYDYPGTYIVTATARDKTATAHASVLVVATAASVSITGLSAGGIAIKNGGEDLLDLSSWVLVEGAANFRIPESTWLAPGAQVLFPSAATGLALAPSALLAYPDGAIAAQYPPAQPAPPAISSPSVQTVESASPAPPVETNAITSTNVENHAPIAPEAGPDAEPPARDASATMTASATSSAAVAAAPASASGGLLHSGWAYGLLGVIVLAGGAFMIL